MLTKTQKASFERDGYLLVPGILSPQQVQELRQFCVNLLDSEPRFKGDVSKGGPIGLDYFRSIRADIFVRYAELRWILTYPPILQTLRNLLGPEIVILPECAILESSYGDWHKDTDAQQRAGHQFHLQPDYRVVEAALYLQDNTPEYGGGLDVVPGSHRLAGNGSESFFARARRKLGRLLHIPDQKPAPKPSGKAKPPGSISIPSKAGDFVIFDYRLDHNATLPSVLPIPPERRKIAVFFGCSANNQHAAASAQFMASRPDYSYFENRSYPPEFVARARNENVILM